MRNVTEFDEEVCTALSSINLSMEESDSLGRLIQRSRSGAETIKTVVGFAVGGGLGALILVLWGLELLNAKDRSGVISGISAFLLVLSTVFSGRLGRVTDDDISKAIGGGKPLTATQRNDLKKAAGNASERLDQILKLICAIAIIVALAIQWTSAMYQ